jgi:hypothetical protein
MRLQHEEISGLPSCDEVAEQLTNRLNWSGVDRSSNSKTTECGVAPAPWKFRRPDVPEKHEGMAGLTELTGSFVYVLCRVDSRPLSRRGPWATHQIWN